MAQNLQGDVTATAPAVWGVEHTRKDSAVLASWSPEGGPWSRPKLCTESRYTDPLERVQQQRQSQASGRGQAQDHMCPESQPFQPQLPE